MISYQTFLNQVDSLQPPVLKRFKKSVKLSGLQGVGLCLLLLWTFLMPLLMLASRQENPNEPILNGEGVLAFMIAFVFYICGWVGFVYSLKFSRQEKREEFQVKSPTWVMDTVVVILNFLIPYIVSRLVPCMFGSYNCHHFGRNKPETLVLMIDAGLTILYFLNPYRVKKNILKKRTAPLYRILSVLGVVWDPENPARFSLNNGISFESQDLTKKFGYYDDNKQFYMNYKGIVFTVPRRSVVEPWDLKNRLEQFVCSLTGQALFFHPQILEIREEHDDKRLTFYFMTYQGTGAQRPNWYQDKYFYYTREDLATIYNDVAQLNEIY